MLKLTVLMAFNAVVLGAKIDQGIMRKIISTFTYKFKERIIEFDY